MNKLTIISFFIFSCLIFVSGPTDAQKHHAELLEQHTYISVKNNKLSRTQSFEILVNNRAGEEFTEIEIPFSKLVRVSNVKAYIKNRNGEIIKKLSKSDIKERSSFPSFSFYEDEFVKEFTLKHNSYPYILYYEFEEKEDEFIYIDYWSPVFDEDIPTRKATLTIDIPKDYNINYKSHNINRFSKDSIDNSYILKWYGEYNGEVKSETFAPPLYDYFPTVVVVPENFKFEEKGSFQSWEKFGAWQYELIKDIVDLPEQEIARIKKKTTNIESKEELIKALYNYLQDETRYINISIETGGLKPYPASYVAEKRYGDCKALSNYFRAILKAVNIDSYYSKISAGETIEKIDHEIPSQQSNHIIVCVPVDNDTLWVDCTSDNPFKYVGTFIQGREVFVINEANSFFAETPALVPEQVLQERKITLDYNVSKHTSAEFNVSYRGKQYEVLNQLTASYNENEQQGILREILIEDSFEPINIVFQEPHRDSSKIVVKYSAQSSDIYKEYGNDLIIKPIQLNIPSIETPEMRTLPVQINYPIFQKDSQTYTIPMGYKTESVPENTSIETKYGTYTIKSETSENLVKITKQFLLKRGNYSLDEYDEFYHFLSSVSESEQSMYITNLK